MNETELETLLVKLSGDATEYNKMLSDAQKSTKEATKAIEDQGKKVEATQSKMEAFSRFAVSAAAAVGASKFIKEASAAWGEQVKQERKLRGALEVNGRAVVTLMKDYGEFSEEIQRTTTLSDDQALALVRQAELYGVSGEQAKRAARNAIGLASVYEGTAQDYIRQTTMLEQGKVGRLAMLLGMGELEEGADKVAEAQAKLAKFTQYAALETNTLTGRNQQLANEYDNLLEEYGKFYTSFTKPVKSFVTNELREIVKWLTELPPWTKQATAAIVGLIAILASLSTALVAAKFAMSGLLKLGGAQALTNIGIQLWAGQIAGATTAMIAFKVALVAAVAIGINKTMEWVGGVSKLKEEYAKAREKLESLDPGSLVEPSRKAFTDKLARIPEVDTTKRIDALKEELKLEEKLLKANEKGVEVTAAKLAKQKGNVLERIPILGDAFEEDRKDTEARLNFSRRATEDSMSRVSALKTQLKELTTSTLSKKNKDDLAELTNELRMTAQTFGMAADEAKIYKLQLQGLTFWQLAEVRVLSDINKKLEESKKLSGEVANVTASAANAVFGVLQKTQDEIVGLTEEFKSPEEKFADRIDRLKVLLGAGLPVGVFNAAVAQATKQLEEAQKAAEGAHQAVQSMDSVLKSSNEARIRRVEYFSKIGATDDADVKTRRVAKPANAVAPSNDPVLKVLKDIDKTLQSIDRKPPTVITPSGIEE